MSYERASDSEVSKLPKCEKCGVKTTRMDYHMQSHKEKTKAIKKTLEKHGEGKRYQAAKMPENYHDMSHEDRTKYYETHKGKMVSNKVNPKTGKYFNTY